MTAEHIYFSAQDETKEQREFLFKRGWNCNPDDLLDAQKQRQEEEEEELRRTIIISSTERDNEQSSDEPQSLSGYR